MKSIKNNKALQVRGPSGRLATPMNMTIRAAARRATQRTLRVPGATLSRIENNKLSPTFGVLARVMMGLEIDWVDLTAPKTLEPAIGF
jgi:hypothetical protein